MLVCMRDGRRAQACTCERARNQSAREYAREYARAYACTSACARACATACSSSSSDPHGVAQAAASLATVQI
eukprot:1847746-Pleurochrysis_carterae.AAC.1